MFSESRIVWGGWLEEHTRLGADSMVTAFTPLFIYKYGKLNSNLTLAYASISTPPQLIIHGDF